MRKLILTGALLILGCRICTADPVAACTNLVGTYAEPREPERPLLTIAFTNGEFAASDDPRKKTIVSVTPTEKGLVLVEDPRERNVFRLSRSEKPDVYVFEYLGKSKEDKPLPEGPGYKKEMIRVQPVEPGETRK
jgi:hypothetical protein